MIVLSEDGDLILLGGALGAEPVGDEVIAIGPDGDRLLQIDLNVCPYCADGHCAFDPQTGAPDRCGHCGG